jgi:hypothetical protein
MSGSLAMLNESGHTMISWTDDLDDEMEKIVEKKLAEGVTFFIIERSDTHKRIGKLEEAAEARKHRALEIPDEDLQKFVGSGATLTHTPDEPVTSSRLSRDAKEVAKSDSVGVKPRRGG